MTAGHNCFFLDQRDRFNLCHKPGYCQYQAFGTPDEPTYCLKDEMIEEMKEQ